MEYDAIYTNEEGNSYRCDYDEIGRIGDGMYKTKYGTKYWYKNGQRHREDGPAIEWEDGAKAWYLNDKFMTEEEWYKNLEPNRMRQEGWDEKDISVLDDLGMFEHKIVDFKTFRSN